RARALRSSPCLTLFPYTPLFRSPLGPPRPATGLPVGRGGRWHPRVPVLLAARDRTAGADLARVRPRDHARTRRDVRAASELLRGDRKSTRLNSSHVEISYAVFCL